LTEFVDSTVKDIDQRLSELKQEVAKLEAARAALVGTRRGPGRPRGSTTRRSRSSASAGRATGRASGRAGGRRTRRTRGRRGGATRANQALELVRSTPGITIPQIATQMGIEPNYLYRVLPRLQQEGAIKRDGQGWVPTGS
jgi:predicted Rossmann fold nucleotide-binding protein DprA/Smf involved in DNA uptake